MTVEEIVASVEPTIRQGARYAVDRLRAAGLLLEPGVRQTIVELLKFAEPPCGGVLASAWRQKRDALLCELAGDEQAQANHEYNAKIDAVLHPTLRPMPLECICGHCARCRELARAGEPVPVVDEPVPHDCVKNECGVGHNPPSTEAAGPSSDDLTELYGTPRPPHVHQWAAVAWRGWRMLANGTLVPLPTPTAIPDVVRVTREHCVAGDCRKTREVAS